MGINFNSNYQNAGQKSQINVKTKTLEAQGNATKIDNTRTALVSATTVYGTNLSGNPYTKVTEDDGTWYGTMRSVDENGNVVTVTSTKTVVVKNNTGGGVTSGLSVTNNDIVAAELAAKFPKNKFM